MAVKSISKNKNNTKNTKGSSNANMNGKVEPIVAHLRTFVGQQVAILCSRFTYWGIVSEVWGGTEPFMILANAVAVEQSGKCESDKPEHFDPLNGPLTLFLNSIEIVFQPRWSQGKLPGKES